MDVESYARMDVDRTRAVYLDVKTLDDETRRLHTKVVQVKGRRVTLTRPGDILNHEERAIDVGCLPR